MLVSAAAHDQPASSQVGDVVQPGRVNKQYSHPIPSTVAAVAQNAYESG